MTSLAAGLGRLVLAAALLAGWHAALVHPVEHVDERGGLVHRSGDHDPHAAGNELCDAIAAVAAVAPGAAAPAHAEAAAAHALPHYLREAPRPAPRPAYRSQAPPSHS